MATWNISSYSDLINWNSSTHQNAVLTQNISVTSVSGLPVNVEEGSYFDGNGFTIAIAYSSGDFPGLFKLIFAGNGRVPATVKFWNVTITADDFGTVVNSRGYLINSVAPALNSSVIDCKNIAVYGLVNGTSTVSGCRLSTNGAAFCADSTVYTITCTNCYVHCKFEW